MNKNCILILAHKNHNQIMRLINHLKTDFDLYVHIDKRNKLNIKSFDNVNVYNKFKTYHGDVSLVIATLFLIREAYKSNYDRYIFISGQDIPLKTNKEIIDFFNTSKEYISYESINNTEAIYKEMSFRLNSYNFGKLYRLIFHRNIRELLSSFPLIKRHTPENIYYGSQWWNLTNDAIKYILDYTDKNPQFLKRFNYTWGSDEFYFQSILLNSEFKHNCINDCLRYIVWSGGAPFNLEMKDYNNIKNNINNNLFARKFDEILIMI